MAKKVSTKKTKPKAEFPSNCPHKNFFGCKTPRTCSTCYYNPDIKQKPLWFYSDKKHAEECLATLADIKAGRGLRRGGKRCPWKHARKTKNDEE